jgi:arylsulfatase A-like enzyme
MSDRPNVLIVCVDHWPGRLLGAAGHPHIHTPALDQLARNGVLFTNAYSTTPTCIPARRELCTGTFSPTHGDRVFNETLRMPSLPTLAQTFRDAGYQAYSVGKLHVYPQRDRIGFDEALINEEGRHHLGMKADDFELYLAEQGYPGEELTHAMCNNEYMTRPWHLPERCHPTNWTAREMCKVIKRRDPTRPALWYMSFNHPHPPLTPLRDYMDIYRDVDVDMPFIGQWAQDPEDLPWPAREVQTRMCPRNDAEIRLARQAFYALCTHIDHQFRLVLGMLNEEGLMDDTMVVFTCDHGDMLGNHRMWAKGVFYEDSAKIPLIYMPTADDDSVTPGTRDDRLATLGDVMPTVLERCGIRIPETVEGMPLVGESRRECLYGEHFEDKRATRMVHDGRHKLIYYPAGNMLQLFDLRKDPNEMRNLADEPAYGDVRARLTEELVKRLHGKDREWVEDGELVGGPDAEWFPHGNRRWSGQRGWRFIGG